MSAPHGDDLSMAEMLRGMQAARDGVDAARTLAESYAAEDVDGVNAATMAATAAAGPLGHLSVAELRYALFFLATSAVASTDAEALRTRIDQTIGLMTEVEVERNVNPPEEE